MTTLTKPRWESRAPKSRFRGMRLIRGGAFRMGADNFYPDEGPVRTAEVGDYWIDETPVTNRQFAEFVHSTGYVTFAEIPPDPLDYPGMDPAFAQPGSLVFKQTAGPVNLKGPPVWWDFVIGANWRHPLGPGSSLQGLDDHPVVHIVHADAEAYAAWAGKTLPSETEWEYAARGGLESASYAWGDEFMPNGTPLANTWLGTFPYQNDAPDDQQRTSAVKSFPPNGYGLFDMIGNVWEWTADWYSPKPTFDTPSCCGKDRPRRAGPQDSLDPTEPVAVPRRVAKGGSHLCAPNHCRRYRPAARWPQPIDTSTSHMGFRCIVRR